jgi:D-3-phosphoglycerate dehydrogenase
LHGVFWLARSRAEYIRQLVAMPFHILATARSFSKTTGAHHAYLAEHGCEVDLRAPDQPLSSGELAKLIVGYDGVILGLDQCDSQVLAAANQLKVISRYGAGVDAVDVAAATQRGIYVTNTPNTNNLSVAELTIGLVFALARDIPNMAGNARQHVWQRTTGWELGGKTLGIIGFGAIGREVARMAHGLGMRTLVFDPFWKGEWLHAQPCDLPTLLAQSKAVTLHCPLTPETRHIINAQSLAQMQDGAVLINTARGGLVDENALDDALNTRKLSGAAMDVFAQEPPDSSNLLTLNTFIATPHMGGTTKEAIERMSMMAAQNLVSVLKGEPCPNIINLQAKDFRA